MAKEFDYDKALKALQSGHMLRENLIRKRISLDRIFNALKDESLHLPILGRLSSWIAPLPDSLTTYSDSVDP